MYCASPPVPRRTHDDVLPLRLSAVVHRQFAEPSSAAAVRGDDPELREYFTDLAALHGIGYRGEALRRGNTFVDMAADMLADPDPVDEPVDVVIIAHATPDLDPRVSAGAAASHRFAGRALVFAVSAPACSVTFTAIRLAGEYVRRHGYRRVLVLALDQSTLPYESTAELGGDAAVALHFESQHFESEHVESATGRVRCGRVPCADADEIGGVAWRIGGGAAVLEQPDRRFPATGIWREYRAGTGALLVQHDPARAQLNYCAIDADETP